MPASLRAPLACAALLLAACGSPPLDPEYTGCGTDENLRVFDDNEPTATVDDTQAPQLTAPDPTMTIPFMPKPVFTWNEDATNPGTSTGDVPYMNCNDCCPEFSPGALTTLHDPPVSGDEYDLQFFEGTTLVYRVITTLQEWTAPDATWSSWKGKTLTLKIYRQAVLQNELKSGPFIAASPTTLHIGS